MAHDVIPSEVARRVQFLDDDIKVVFALRFYGEAESGSSVMSKVRMQRGTMVMFVQR